MTEFLGVVLFISLYFTGMGVFLMFLAIIGKIEWGVRSLDDKHWTDSPVTVFGAGFWPFTIFFVIPCTFFYVGSSLHKLLKNLGDT